MIWVVAFAYIISYMWLNHTHTVLEDEECRMKERIWDRGSKSLKHLSAITFYILRTVPREQSKSWWGKIKHCLNSWKSSRVLGKLSAVENGKWEKCLLLCEFRLQRLTVRWTRIKCYRWTHLDCRVHAAINLEYTHTRGSLTGNCCVGCCLESSLLVTAGSFFPPVHGCLNYASDCKWVTTRLITRSDFLLILSHLPF